MRRKALLRAFMAGIAVPVLLAVVWLLRSEDRSIPTPVHAVEPVRVVPSARSGRQKPVRTCPVDVSSAVQCVCGFDLKTARRFTARNSALRSIADRRDLPPEDVDALLGYIVSTEDTMRADRTAALKNDVLNLLRNQNPVPDLLPAVLADMIVCDDYDVTIVDYCIQHLGAMWRDIVVDDMRRKVRETFKAAALRRNLPYAGTALYSLADEPGASADSQEELRRLAVGTACDASANQLARMTAFQLAARRGYVEVLPSARAILAEAHPDAVLATVAIGTIGCIGDAGDISLLERVRVNGGRRLLPALDAALARLDDKRGRK